MLYYVICGQFFIISLWSTLPYTKQKYEKYNVLPNIFWNQPFIHDGSKSK